MKQYLIIAITCIGLSMAFGVQAEIFKSIDKDGNVIYSDVPQNNAKPVTLPQATVYTPPPPVVISPSSSSTTPQDASTSVVVAYKSVKIEAPLSDAVYTNEAAGNIAASVSVDPALSPGDKVQFIVDGKPHGAASPSLQISLTGLERGAHSVSAKVVNGAGATIKQSAPVTFHVKHNSALFKKGAR